MRGMRDKGILFNFTQVGEIGAIALWLRLSRSCSSRSSVQTPGAPNFLVPYVGHSFLTATRPLAFAPAYSSVKISLVFTGASVRSLVRELADEKNV